MNKAHLPKLRDIQGAILAPAILYMIGVPFTVVLVLWFFFFRG